MSGINKNLKKKRQPAKRSAGSKRNANKRLEYAKRRRAKNASAQKLEKQSRKEFFAMLDKEAKAGE